MSKTVFLGVEGSGKTTLTMALAQAFESHKNEGWYLKPLSRDSFRFLKTLPDTFDGNFPSQTADLRELRWQAEYKGNDLGEITILDYPGEIYRLAFLDEKDERDPEAFRQKVASNKPEIDALLGVIKDAEDVFVLFNLADGTDLRNNPRNLDAVWVTNECLKLLKRLESKPRIRLLFTQVDRYRSAGFDLSAFSPNSIDLIGHDNPDVPWSMVSVVDRPDSEYGIDEIVRKLVVKPLRDAVTEQMPVDIGNVDVVKLLPGDMYRDTFCVDMDYLEKIDKTVNVGEEICTSGAWLIQDIFPNKIVASDWEKIMDVVSGINNMPIVNSDFKVDYKMFESQRGKDIAKCINDRIGELVNEAEKFKRDNRIGLIVFSAIIGALVLWLLIVCMVN